ncbi:hypothetical protein ACJ8BM_28105, partial [Klebsiella pneumoniae]
QLKFIGFASEPAITLNLLSGQKINGHIGSSCLICFLINKSANCSKYYKLSDIVKTASFESVH